MTCVKCSYKDSKEVVLFAKPLCTICATFAPRVKEDFESYISEHIDWKVIDTFRRKGHMPGFKQKKGMHNKAKEGRVVTRAPLGYTVKEGKLILNQDAIRVRGIFNTFLKKEISLNQLSKQQGLSVNGLKKILTNRTYLGEIKFDGALHKADHKALLAPEVFYAVQRKLQQYLKPRKEHPNRYKDLTGEVAPLTKEIIITKESLYDSVFEK